jgi:hypothetical protein
MGQFHAQEANNQFDILSLRNFIFETERLLDEFTICSLTDEWG